MKDLGKRIIILLAFGAGFAVFLLVVLKVRGGPEIGRPASESNTARPAVESEPSTSKSFQVPPEVPSPEPSEGRAMEHQAPVPPDPTKSLLELKKLFTSGKADSNGEIDWTEVERLLRDHVDHNHPSLKMSDADYRRLAAAMRSFREANEKTRSMERTSANAAAIRQSLEEVGNAMREFSQLTGMSPGEFFLEEDRPVTFGNDP